MIRWAIKARSENKLDGKRSYFTTDAALRPFLFRTREEARYHIQEVHGYLRWRSDLRAEPHGWKMPQAVRVEVILKEFE